MQGLIGRVSLCFAGGVFGALIAGVLVWMAGQYGWNAALGVAIAPQWEESWILPRLVWGGAWGLLFAPGLLGRSILAQGALLSLLPTLVQLFVTYAAQPEAGLGGLGLGTWTPLVVVVTNVIWGWCAAVWIMGGSTDEDSAYHRLR